ncbi:MAG TPA: tRNA (guanosine(37)-N1)-methyltransferase TrmD [Candidatus Bathyarchaeia archaeon]|nr:tRNA (guanosine(37)-N1)-methyltransferase TrmD [Candidatus Bathyarchaeia archaeon]
MKIDILTLFPAMFKGPFEESIIKRAQDKGFVEIKIHDLRQWTKDRYKTVDDRPYGGGTGMIMRVDIIERAILDIKNKKTKTRSKNQKIILLTPQGKVFNQQRAQELSKLDRLILICGHYEGVDERIRKYLVDEEISIGDYILTGGELPAMVLTDSIVRLLPGVLHKPEAVELESFSHNKNNHLSLLLEYPQYTRPANFRGWKVPPVLLSGNHQKIENWRQEQALKRTRKRRPDLLKSIAR